MVLKLLKINVFLYIKAIYLAESSLSGQLSWSVVLFDYGCNNAPWEKKKKRLAYDNIYWCFACESSGWLWFGWAPLGLTRLSWARSLDAGFSCLKSVPWVVIILRPAATQGMLFSWWITEFQVRPAAYSILQGVAPDGPSIYCHWRSIN